MANLQPAGQFLMDDLYRAGGVLALLAQVKDLLHPEPITVTGIPLVDYLDDRPVYDETVILPRETPLVADAGIAVLRGNLAPRGAIIKPARRLLSSSSTSARRSSSTASRTCGRASTNRTST